MKITDKLKEKSKEAKSKVFKYDANESLIVLQCDYINFLGFEFRRNVVRMLIEYRYNGGEWKDVDDSLENDIWADFQTSEDFDGKKGVKPSISRIKTLIDSKLLSTPYNPIEEYFSNLKWDGKDHIALLTKTVKVKDDPDNEIKASQHWPELFRRWLIACVHCGLGKGANHVMLTLIGKQGGGKTTWLNKLCPAYLKDYIHTGHVNPKDKDTVDILAEKFFCNIDDQLSTLQKQDFNAIKSMITVPFIGNRKAYARRSSNRPRIANFMGSVNDENIFHDVENRRYLTFNCETIDFKHKVDLNQVWAQAFELYKKGEKCFFSADDVKLINGINESYSVTLAEKEWFLRMYDILDHNKDFNGSYLQANEIISAMQKASGQRLSAWKLSAIVFKKLNVTRVGKWINGQNRYVYYLRCKYVVSDGRVLLMDEMPEGTTTQQGALYQPQQNAWKPVQEK